MNLKYFSSGFYHYSISGENVNYFSDFFLIICISTVTIIIYVNILSYISLKYQL